MLSRLPTGRQRPTRRWTTRPWTASGTPSTKSAAVSRCATQHWQPPQRGPRPADPLLSEVKPGEHDPVRVVFLPNRRQPRQVRAEVARCRGVGLQIVDVTADRILLYRLVRRGQPSGGCGDLVASGLDVPLQYRGLPPPREG